MPKIWDPRIVCIIRWKRSMYLGCSSSDGGSKRWRDKVVQVFITPGIRPNNWSVAGKYTRGMWPRMNSAWWWNKAVCRPFVKWSARLIDVSICSRSMRSRSTHSEREKYLMSMWRVRGVGFWAFAIAVQASLSSYRRVAASCGMLRSQRMLRRNKIILLMKYADAYSASVEEPTRGTGWNCVLYATVPPARRRHKPPKDRQVFTHVAQSKSAYAYATLASWSGWLSRRRSCLFLWIGVKGPSESSICWMSARNRFHPPSCYIDTWARISDHGNGSCVDKNWTVEVSH